MLCRSAISGTETEGTPRGARPERPGASWGAPASQHSAAQPKLPIPARVPSQGRPTEEPPSPSSGLQPAGSPSYAPCSLWHSKVGRCQGQHHRTPPSPAGARGLFTIVLQAPASHNHTLLCLFYNIYQYGPAMTVCSQTDMCCLHRSSCHKFSPTEHKLYR